MQRDEQAVAEKAAALVESRKKAKAARKDIFKRAESYVEEYRSQVGFKCHQQTGMVEEQSQYCNSISNIAGLSTILDTIICTGISEVPKATIIMQYASKA